MLDKLDYLAIANGCSFSSIACMLARGKFCQTCGSRFFGGRLIFIDLPLAVKIWTIVAE
ncbi:hypothetical protein HW132_33690 [Brasilonema sp. CT11]|nr:hypothetical protein [Brasilonema sp. CT11]